MIPAGKPRCFNRPPLPAGQWVRTHSLMRVRYSANPFNQDSRVDLVEKEVYRFRWSPFADRCVSWDAPKIEDSVPARERWRCAGCRLLPPQAETLAQWAERQAKPGQALLVLSTTQQAGAR